MRCYYCEKPVRFEANEAQGTCILREVDEHGAGAAEHSPARCAATRNDRAARIEKAVRAIVANEHVNLGDLVYQVREREGLGWEGPSVKAWSDAVDALEAALKEAP